MSQISLIALDLDGTLLNSEKKISPRNRAALAAAQAQGVKVVLTTGRPLKAMDFLLEELGTAGLKEEYTITFNGGLVQRNNGEILSKVVLAQKMSQPFMMKQPVSDFRWMRSVRERFMRFIRNGSPSIPITIPT